MAFFRFGDEVLYTREPTHSIVIEQRPNGIARGFDRDGTEIMHSSQPFAPPEWN
jgi:hypothetical protein